MVIHGYWIFLPARARGTWLCRAASHVMGPGHVAALPRPALCVILPRWYLCGSLAV